MQCATHIGRSGQADTSIRQRLTLVCLSCGHAFPATGIPQGCESCGHGYLSVDDVFAPVSLGDRVSLGEGGTPLVRMPGKCETWVKNEGVNPTNSYKDRFNAVNVSVAKSLGARGVALISTGNAGVSAAAYCAAAGLEARVICSPEVTAEIAEDIASFGGQVEVFDQDARRRAALRTAIDEGYAPGSRSVPAIDVTPFGYVGYRSIAVEIVEQLGSCPAAVSAPVGGGDGILGIGEGFRRLVDAGSIGAVPQLIGARSTSPYASSIAYDEVNPHARDMVTASGGRFVDVSENALVDALHVLSRAGVSAEPASAAAFAAAQHVDRAVCVITGGGLRWRSDRVALEASVVPA